MLSLPGQLAAPVAMGPMEVGGSIDLEAKLLRVERATGSVAGSDVTASGQLSLGADGIGGKGEATIDSVDADELVRLWPESVASDARQWVSTHVEAGSIGRAAADLSLQPAQGNKPASLDLSGTFSATGVTVRYLDGAPPAQDVSATARFSKDALTFQLTKGRSRDVRVDGGEVSLTGLAGDTAQLAVDLRLASTVPAALDLAGSLPKDIVPSLPVSPDKARGQATIRLKLGLPLADKVSADQVRYNVQAQLDDLVVLGLVPGLDLSDGALSLEVAGSALTASGKARLQTVPLTLKQLRVDFSGKGPPATTAEISGHLEPISLSMLGVDPPSFLDGAADIDLTLDLAGAEPSKAHVVADLRPTVIKLPALRIDKSAGQPGRVEADIAFGKAGAVTLPSLSLSLPDVEVRGSLALAAGQDHHLSRLDLDRLDLQGSRLSLTVSSKQDGGWDASLGGERLDLRPWLGGGKGSGGGGASQAGGGRGSALPALALKVDVGEVALPGGSLRNLKGSVERSASQWQQGSIAADLASGKPVQATLGSGGGGTPRLEVRTEDAGSFISTIAGGGPLAPGGTLRLGDRHPGRGSDSQPPGRAQLARRHRARRAAAGEAPDARLVHGHRQHPSGQGHLLRPGADELRAQRRHAHAQRREGARLVSGPHGGRRGQPRRGHARGQRHGGAGVHGEQAPRRRARARPPAARREWSRCLRRDLRRQGAMGQSERHGEPALRPGAGLHPRSVRRHSGRSHRHLPRAKP